MERDNDRELLAACKLALKYLYKLEEIGVETALPVKAAINRVEAAIANAKAVR
jgi:hypothetical protein